MHKIKVNSPVFVYNDSHLSLKPLFYKMLKYCLWQTCLHDIKKQTSLASFVAFVPDEKHEIYIYIIHAAVTLDYYSAGVCCIRNRENDRKVRSIVDRKPEKK